MALIDIIIGLPLIYGIFSGYKRGVLIEMIGILAVIIAIYFSLQMLSVGSGLLSKISGNSFNSPFLSFIAVFIPSIFLIRKVGYSVKKSLKLTFIGTLDSLGGAVLGGITWLFGLSSIIWVLSKIGINLPIDWTKDNYLYKYVAAFAPYFISQIAELMPDDINWKNLLNNLLESSKK